MLRLLDARNLAPKGYANRCIGRDSKGDGEGAEPQESASHVSTSRQLDRRNLNIVLVLLTGCTKFPDCELTLRETLPGEDLDDDAFGRATFVPASTGRAGMRISADTKNEGSAGIRDGLVGK